MTGASPAVGCSACGAVLENPQRCRACGVFEPHDARRDHFATLALPRRFDLDESLLERRVVAFGRDLHPDLAGTSAAAKARAVLGCAQVNEAYSVLRDRHRRGEYLLALEGGPSAALDKTVPEGFLEAMLDERDAIETALKTGESACDALGERFAAQMRAGEHALARGFAGLATAGADAARAAALGVLRRELNMMNYWRTLARDLRDGRDGRGEEGT
jgi:Fe-S protein assembly co-chaperone HscB